MRARDIMSHPVVTIRDDASLMEAAKVMLEKRIGGLPVVDAGYGVVGVLSESNFVARDKPLPFSLFEMPQLFGEWVGKDGLEKIYEDARHIQVSHVMTKPALTATEDATLEEIAALMTKHDVKRIPILRDGQPVGIVTRHDLLKVVAGGKA